MNNKNRRRKQGSTRQFRNRRLLLESLENRQLLATVTWQGDDVTSPTGWNVAANWDTGTVPTAADDVIVNDVANDPILGGSFAVGSLAGNGVIAFGPVTVPFTNDGDSGISNANTYTHAVDFNAGGTPANINGVAFEDANTTSGSNWSLTGVPNPFPGAGTGTDNDELLSDFFYNGNPGTLTLSGLTNGQSYDLRLYQKLWGGPRVQQFTLTADGVSQVVTLDQDGGPNKSYFSFKYTAGASGTVSISALPLGGATYHWYGFTNQTTSDTSSTTTLTIGGTNTDSTFSGTINGFGGITKVGTGTLTLSGTNSNYNGVTTLAGGVLNAASLSDYGSNSSLGNRAVDSGGNVGLLFQGGTLQYTGAANQSTNRAIRVSTVGGAVIDSSGAGTLSFTATTSPDFFENPGARNVTFTGTNTGANTFAMQIGDAGGATSVVKSGVGTWAFSGANSYGGQTDIQAGTLRLQSNTALGVGGFNGATMSFVRNGASLELDGNIVIDEHMHIAGDGVGGTGAIRAINGNSQFTTAFALDDNGSSHTVTFNVAGGFQLWIGNTIYSDGGVTAALVKTGFGEMVIAADAVYSGGTIVNAGVLTPFNATGGNARIRGTATVNAGAELRFFGLGDNTGMGFNGGAKIDTLNINGGLVNSANAGSHIWYATVNMTGGELRVNGGVSSNSGDFFEWGNSTLNVLPSATPAVISGQLRIRGEQNSAPIFNVAAGATVNITAAITDAVSAGGFTKTGAGTLQLSAANTYTGNTFIDGGKVVVSNNDALGTLSGGTFVNGGTLELNNVNYTTAEPLFLSGTGLAGNGVLVSTGTSSFAGPVSLSGDGNLALYKPASQISEYGGGQFPAYLGTDGDTNNFTHTSAGDVLAPWWQVDLGDSQTIQTINLFNRGGGCCPERLTDYWVFVSDTPFGPNDDASVLATRANTYSNHQTSQVGYPTPLDLGSVQGRYIRVQQNVGNNGVPLSIGEIQVYASSTTNLISTPTNGDALTLSGVVSGGGSLTKVGNGTLSLTTSDSTYTGGTIVNGGLMILDGAINGTARIRGTATVNTGTELRLTGGDGTGFGFNGGAKLDTLNINGGLVNSTNVSHLWYATVNMTGGELRVNGGVSDVNGNQFEWGNSTVNVLPSATSAVISGRIRIRGEQNSAPIFNVADGAATNDLIISAAITDAVVSAGFTKTGAGTLQITSAGDFTGTSYVYGGTVVPTVDGAFGTTAGGTFVSGGTIQLNNLNYTTAEPLTLIGSGVGGNGALVATGTSTFAGPVTLSSTTNAAEGKGAFARQSTEIGFPASNGVNGNFGDFTHTAGDPNPWWQIDLGSSISIGNLDLYNRGDGCCQYRLSSYYIFISDNPFDNQTLAQVQARVGVDVTSQHPTTQAGSPSTFNFGGVSGRYIRIQKDFADVVSNGNDNILSIGELVVPNAALANAQVSALGATDTLNLTGVISGAGNLIKTGAGTVNLSGNNNYTSQTYVNTGTLRLQSSTALGVGGFNGATMSFVRNGASLELDGNLVIDEHMHIAGDGVGGTGAIRAINGNSQFTTAFALDDNGSSHSVTFNVANGATFENDNVIYSDGGVTAGLVKIGPGEMIIAADTSYTGGTTVNAGVLTLLNASGGNGRIRGIATVNAGAELRLFGGDGTGFGYNGGAKLDTLNINGGLVNSTNVSHLWYATVNMTGGELRVNGGVSDVNGNQFEWGNSTVNVLPNATSALISGRIRIRGEQNSAPIFNVADGAAANDLIISAAITDAVGAGGFTKTGAGTLQLTGAGNNSGTSYIFGGNVIPTVDGAFGSAAGGTFVSGGTIQLNNLNYATAEPLTLIGSGVGGNGGLVATGTSTFAGPITLSSTSNLTEGKGILARQSSDLGGYPASNGVNGSINDFTHTAGGDLNPWWQIDLGTSYTLGDIDLYNRGGGCCPERLTSYYIFVSDNPFDNQSLSQVQARVGSDVTSLHPTTQVGAPSTFNLGGISGRYIRIQKDFADIAANGGADVLSIGELQVQTTAFATSLVNVVAATDSLTLSNQISGGGSLTKVGNGTISLTTVDSTYTGGTVVNGGVLILDGATGGTGRIRGSATVNSGTELRLTGGDGTGFGFIGGAKLDTLNINGGLVNSTNGAHLWGATVNITGGELRVNNGVSNASGDAFQWNYVTVNVLASANATTISGHINLRGDGGYAAATFNVADGAAANDLVLSAAITELSGAVGITKTGAGTLLLNSAVNNYSGITSIAGGTLVVTVDNALGATSGGTAITGGTLLFSGGFNYNATEPVIVSGAGNIQSVGANSFAGTISMASGNVSQGKVATQSSISAGGDASRAVDGNTDGAFFNGSVTHTAGGPSDWWEVDMGASYSIGDVNIFNRTDCCGDRLEDYYVFISDTPFATNDLSTLKTTIPVANQIHDVSPAPSPSATLNFGGMSGRYVRVQKSAAENPFNGNDGVLSLAEVQVFATLPSTTIHTATAGDSLTLSGAISGSGSLTKSGLGTVALSAASTYSSDTNINAGTLLVNGSIASNVIVNNGGTLGGAGTVNSANDVTVNLGGNIAPGNSPGILNVGDVIYYTGGVFNVEIAGTTVGSEYDQLNVTGTVNLNADSGSGATLNVTSSFTAADNATFIIINNDGSDLVSGEFNGLPEGSAIVAGVNHFHITYIGGDGNDVALVADATLPSVVFTLQTPAGAITNSDTLTFRATFSEPVMNVDAADFDVNGLAGLTIAVTAISSTQYDVTFSGVPLVNFNGTVGLNLATGQNITDLALNALPTVEPTPTATNDQSYTVDNVAPTVSVTTTVANPTNASVIPFTVTFSEHVNNFVVGDLDITGTSTGTVSDFTTTDGIVYTFNFNPTTDGTIIIDVAAAVANDDAGNNSTAATQLTITSDRTAPTTAITTTAANPSNLATLPITVTFSETVTGFVQTDVVIVNGTISAFTAVSGSVYTFNVTPTADGPVTVDIAANAAQDLATNDNTAATQLSITSDRTAPGVTITSTATSPSNAASYPITVTFTENVIGFLQSDLDVANGSISAFTAVSGSVYTFTVTPTADGAVTVDIPANVAQDLATNDNTAATQLSITSDRTAPGVTITSTATSPSNAASYPVTVTFTENVIGFTQSDLVVANGSISAFTAVSGSVYTFTVTPTADGAVTMDIPANVANDLATNNNTVATQLSITSDRTAPGVTITSTATSPSNAASYPVTVTFTENVIGFLQSDLVVANGTISGFAVVSGSVYTFTVTPTADGVVTVNIPANIANDAASNGNTVATQLSITSDRTAPTVAISTITNPTSVSPILVTVTFSEHVNNFVVGDLNITGTASGTVSGFTTTDGITYTFSFNPTTDGTIIVNVAAGVANDDATNNNTAAAPLNITYDTALPSVTITSTATSPSNLATFHYTVVLSKPVADFTASDVTGATIINFAGSGTTYTFDVVPTADGVITVNVPAGVAHDSLGNANTFGTLSITSDRTAPTVAITSTATSPSNLATIPVTVTFSENVIGFTQSDLAVVNASISNFVIVSGSVYTFDLAPTADGLITVNIAANIANDQATNPNIAATQYNITSDRTAPGVSITSTAISPSNAASYPVTVTFTETVTGFTQSDLVIVNGSVSAFTVVSGAIYTFILTPTADGAVTVNVPANIANDLATNNNTVASQLSITSDRTAPTVVISTTAPSLTNLASIPITTTFSEPVTGFVQADVVVTNGTISGFTPVSATVYTFNIVPTADGAITVNIAANVANDSATNGTIVAPQLSLTSDRTAPATVSFLRQSPLSASTGSAILIYRATFSEAVANIDPADFTVNSATTATVTAVSLVSPGVYDVTISGGDLLTFTGLIGLNLATSPAQDITDLAGNPLPAGEPTPATNDETYNHIAATAPHLYTEVTSSPLVTSDALLVVLTRPEGITTATNFTVVDPDLPGDPLTYTIDLLNSPDAAAFTIVPTSVGNGTATAKLVFNSGFGNFENPLDNGADNTYEIYVTVTDSYGLTSKTQLISISIENVNDAPTFTVPTITGLVTDITINENTPSPITFKAADVDNATTDLRFNISKDTLAASNVDGGLFSIDPVLGTLTFKQPGGADYDSPQDAGKDNVYNIDVQVSDGVGGVTTNSFTITILPQNDNLPIFTTGPDLNVNEETQIVTTIAASDVDLKVSATAPTPPLFDNQVVTYSIVPSASGGAADSDLFSINTNTGLLQFVSTKGADYDAVADKDGNNIYEVTVRANDGFGGTKDRVFHVTLNPVNDLSPVIDNDSLDNVQTTPPINPPLVIRYNEEQAISTIVTTTIATDGDRKAGSSPTTFVPADVLEYTLTGTDSTLFNLDKLTGKLTFKAQPNFELPADANKDNNYDLILNVNDGVPGHVQTQAFTVQVRNINDAPIITSNGGLATAAVSVNESIGGASVSVTNVVAGDDEVTAGSQVLFYTISGGDDSAAFSINKTTGALVFKINPDYENPADKNKDNIYLVKVRVTDSGSPAAFDEQDLTITILNTTTTGSIIAANASADIELNDLLNQDNNFNVSFSGGNYIIQDTSVSPDSTIDVSAIPGAKVDSTDGNKVYLPASVFTTGGQHKLVINAGLGNDYVTINAGNSALPVTPSAGLVVNLGGGNNDTLDLDNFINNAGDNNWTTTGAQAGTIALGSGLGTISFDGLENAIGGNNRDLFKLKYAGVSGILTINGGDAVNTKDTIEITRSGKFVLADSQLTITPSTAGQTAGQVNQTFGLSNIKRANLSGSTGNDTFDVSGWTQHGDGTLANNYGGALSALGGTDVVIKRAELTSGTITNGDIQTSDGMRVALAGNILPLVQDTNGATPISFDISGLSRTGTLIANKNATDEIKLSGSFFNVVLDETYIRVNTTQINLTNFNKSTIVGGGNDQTSWYRNKSWTGTQSFDGGGGTDQVIFSENSNLTMTPTLATIGARNIQLQNVESFKYKGFDTTGISGNNTINLTDWNNAGVIEGGDGLDQIVIDRSSSSAVQTIDIKPTAMTINGKVINLVKPDVTTWDALLKGGSGSDAFSLSNWRGTATIVGNGGANIMSINRDRDMDLSTGLVTIKKLASSLTDTDKAINYSNISELTIAGGNGANTYTLGTGYDSGLAAGSNGLKILTNSDGDTLKTSLPMNISVTTGSTSSTIVLGARTLTATNFQTPDIVNFTGTAANTYTFTNYTGKGTLTGMNSVAFTYNAQATNLTVNSTSVQVDSAAKTFTINGALAGGLSLTGGPQTNLFTVNGWTKTLTINGGVNSTNIKDTLAVTTSAANVTLAGDKTSATLEQSALPTWSLSNIEIAKLTGSKTTGQTFTLSDWSYGGVLTANLTGKNDQLVYQTNGNMTLTNGQLTAGTRIWTIANIDTANLTGGSGDDTIDARNFPGALVIDGGLGNDIIFGGVNNDRLDGNSGDDWIFGNDGNDIITGGNGQDILIGGRGIDRLNTLDGTTLSGDSGEDVLIGGTTNYDMNSTAILAIMTEWSKTGPGNDFVSRVNKLKSLTTKLDSSTVHDDSSLDTLIGGTQEDWYFYAPNDTLPSSLSPLETAQKVAL